MKELLSCKNIEKTMGGHRLFVGLNFRMYSKEHIGLIGFNGSGKSTLLKILTGIVDADAGEVTKVRNLNLIYLPQIEKIDPNQTILDVAGTASKDDVLELANLFLTISSPNKSF